MSGGDGAPDRVQGRDKSASRTWHTRHASTNHFEHAPLALAALTLHFPQWTARNNAHSTPPNPISIPGLRVLGVYAVS